MTQSFLINSAPAGDGWILARQRIEAGSDLCPWVIATRCDDGWRDVDGYPVEPIEWAPLPDPQPKPTGWTSPVGTIRIVRGKIKENGWTGWLSFYVKPDGSDDDDRECSIFDTLEDAEQWVNSMAARWGLSVEVDETPFPDAKVLEFPAGSRQ